MFHLNHPRDTHRYPHTKLHKPSWLSVTISPQATPSESFITHHPLSTVLLPQCCLGDRSLRISSPPSQAALQSGLLPANLQPHSHLHHQVVAESQWLSSACVAPHYSHIITIFPLCLHSIPSLLFLLCLSLCLVCDSVSFSPPRSISIWFLQSVTLKDSNRNSLIEWILDV